MSYENEDIIINRSFYKQLENSGMSKDEIESFATEVSIYINPREEESVTLGDYISLERQFRSFYGLEQPTKH